MADDDDDDSFGEFTFAPSSTTQTPATSDFTSPQNKSPHQKWQKINGAIPLSLFGDPDDDHESQDDLKNLSFSGNSNGFVSNNNNDINRKNGNLEINDLIANLYGEPKQLNHNNNNVSKVVENGNVYKDPVSNSGSADHGSDEDDEDGEGGWDFVDAFSDSKNDKDKDNKERVVTSVSNGGIDQFAGSNNGVFVESNGTGIGFNSKPVASFQNGFSKAEPNGAANELSSEKLGESDDFDDTFGEFETAFVENSSTKKELSEEKFDPLGSYDVSHRPIDLFAFSNGVLGGSHKENNEFNFSQSPVVQNGVASDPIFQTEWKETRDDSYSQSPDMGADDEDFGEFEATFPEAGLKPEGSMASSKSYKEAVPLSIFGIEEEPEADSSLNLQLELFKSSTHVQNPSSNLSINDILSDLYSQAQPISSANNEGNPDGNVSLLHSTGEEYSSHVVDDDDDDFNDGSWEFKDASFQSSVKNENLSFKKKLNHCMDLYSNLKDDLLVVARRHLHGLKKAQSAATLVGEEMKVATVNEDIQEALKELHQEDIISAEMDFDKHSERVTSLDQYIETLSEPDFQAIESEYHISRRLSLAESDLRTAVDLINHFTTVLKILTLAPKADPADYVSLWSKMIFVCSQELKHGISIWKRSLEKNIHNEILAEPQGKDFIIAIGEIYRAVVILGSAVKFYKPWILLSGAELEGVYSLLEECHSLWSTSGLEETFPAESLLDSIRHIRNLDELAITNEILSQEESQCVLSLLSPSVVPEMKLVIWNGDKYFVSLANLWANLVSTNPPKLSVHVG